VKSRRAPITRHFRPLRAFCFWLALICCLTALAPARAETLLISLSTEKIQIDSGFTGANLVIFGAITRDGPPVAGETYDVVVTIRGPRGAVTVREKQEIGPLWLNADFRKYIVIPAYLAVLSNAPLDKIADEATRDRLRLGVDRMIPAQPDRARGFDGNEQDFRAALIRLRTRQRLFGEFPTGVKLLNPTIFRANAPIPGAAPLGAYDAEVVVLSQGHEVARAKAAFSVSKIGVEDWLARMSREQSWLYGLGAVAMALLAGWIASLIFRRD
jgi:uncharacterized protein (TIGR02186 family)